VPSRNASPAQTVRAEFEKNHEVVRKPSPGQPRFLAYPYEGIIFTARHRAMKRILLIVVCATALVSVSGKAQDLITQHRRACLEGFGRVFVYVDYYEGEEQKAKQFQTQVELRLRQAGIQVQAGGAVLFLGRSHASYPFSPCRIQANVNEVGKFKRGYGFFEMSVTTWESSLHGTTQDIKGNDWESTRKVLSAAVDEFINDYLAANQTEEKLQTKGK
jgi:hypothetical protein